VLARDRAAGLEGGTLSPLAQGEAAAVAEAWGALASSVRKNVAPAALLIEAAAVLARRGRARGSR
jgi:hypothetical protein